MKPIDLSSSISTIMEFTHDGILLLDPSGMIIAANPAANSILGFNQEYNFLQSEHKFTDLFYFSDINDKNVPFEQSPVPRALKGECVVDYEGKAVNIKTGNVRYWLYSAIPIFNETKGISGVVISIKDTTDSTLEISKCQKDKDYYRSIISFMAEGVVVVGPDGTFLDVNPAAMHIYGFKNGNEAVKNVDEYKKSFILYDLDGNLLPVEKWPLLKALRKESFSNNEVKVFRKETGKSWIGNYSGTPVIDASGKFVRVVLTIQDITIRKQTEAALHQYEIYLSTIIEAGADGILAVDSKGRVIKANSRFSGLLKIPETTISKMAGDNDSVLSVASDQLIESNAFIKKARRLYGSNQIDTDVLSLKDGRVLECYSAPIPQDGTIIGRVWSFRDITRQTESKKALAESEKLFRLALLAGGYGVYDFDITTNIANVNDKYVTMLEYTPGELQITLEWWINSIHPEDRTRSQSILMDCVYGKIQEYKMEFRMRTKSGSYKWILCQGKNVEYDLNKRPLRMVGTHIDITKRKNAENALREERNKLTKIAATVPGVICSYRERADGSSHMPYASPALVPIAGFKPEEVAEDMSPMLNRIHPDDINSMIESIAKSKRTLLPWHLEYRYFHPQKGMIWIEGNSVPQREADGSTIWHGFITDITERKQAEEVLQEERDKLANIAATVPGVIYSYRQSPDGSASMPYASPALFDVMGVKPEDVVDDVSPILNLIHPDDIGKVKESIAESFQSQSNWRMEFRYNHPVKGAVWIEAHSVPKRGVDGSMIWHGFARDVTNRKRYEESLRLSEEKFSKAFMTSPDSITITRLKDDTLVEVNNGTLEVFGYSRDEMVGHSTLPGDLNIWVDKKDREKMMAILKANGEVNGFEAILQRKDGLKINVIASARIIKMEGDYYLLKIVKNITAQKGIEAIRNRLTRELRALNSCNQALIRVENEQVLLDEICRIICDVAGYRTVWVGFIENESLSEVTVVAHAGAGEYFMKDEIYSYSDNRITPVVNVMQSKKSFIIQDIESVQGNTELRLLASKNGWRSIISLPLLEETGDPFGVLCIYSVEANIFTFEEVHLLEELGGNLAFGIRNLRLRVERKLTQSALIHEKELTDALIEATPGFFCVMDNNGAILRMNKNMARLMGKSRDPLYLVYRSDIDLAKEALHLLINVKHLEEDIRFELEPGKISWWRISGHSVNITGTVYLIATAFDITQRKQIENNLQKTLREKEILLQELYHRTKNNMQVISSFLAMQAMAVDDEKLQIILSEMENRIGAMALVHEKLYKSKDLTNINLKDYLRDLANLVFRGFPSVSERVSLVFEAEEVFVTMDIAIPIGLVVTELLTNSLKYAFPDKRSGRIILLVKNLGVDGLELHVSDNGVGIAGKFNFEQKGTIGIPTVLSIVRKQLCGSVQLDTTHGFHWKISFRCDLYGKRV